MLIFLDVDGVLNSHRSCLAYRGFGEDGWDPVAVGLLDRLCGCLKERGKDPKVVISSTWRMMFPHLLWWAEQFKKYGAGNVEAIGRTPEFGGIEPNRRGREVAHWLAENAPDVRFVCLDDDADFLPGQPLFQTSFSYGLSVEQVDGALVHLTGEPHMWPRVAVTPTPDQNHPRKAAS